MREKVLFACGRNGGFELARDLSAGGSENSYASRSHSDVVKRKFDQSGSKDRSAPAVSLPGVSRQHRPRTPAPGLHDPARILHEEGEQCNPWQLCSNGPARLVPFAALALYTSQIWPKLLFGATVRADLPPYPRGPRSGPGYSGPSSLNRPIRPTRGHIPTSPSHGLYEMPSLCIFAYA